MTAGDLAAACGAEVVELHAFFEGWFNGTLPDTGAAFGRFSDVLASSFSMIDPSGATRTRAEVLDVVRRAHATDASRPMSIRIHDARARIVRDGLALVTYEEWQRHGDDPERGRVSTALFAAQEDAPNGVGWLHVHETWLASG